MDGHYVPNLTFGPLVVEALRRVTDLPLDVHLMVQAPERVVPWFAESGASILTVHVEACTHLHRVVQMVKEAGLRAGVALNPATPVSAVEEVLPEVDLVLVMTVSPGFPAQSFIPSVLPKVRRMRALLDELGSEAELEVDGGINGATAPQVVAAGPGSWWRAPQPSTLEPAWRTPWQSYVAARTPDAGRTRRRSGGGTVASGFGPPCTGCGCSGCRRRRVHGRP